MHGSHLELIIILLIVRNLCVAMIIRIQLTLPLHIRMTYVLVYNTETIYMSHVTVLHVASLAH